MNSKTLSFLLMLFGSLTLYTASHADDSKSATPTLTVTGQATIYKPADELNISIGVISQGKTAEDALKINNQKMQVILESVATAGLRDKEYKTGQFSIQPIYNQRPTSPSPDWQPQIIGYEVTNSISVKTDKIKIAGTLIDNVTQAGANNINSIQFDLKDPQMYRADIISAATQNALTDAQALSHAANVTLGKIRSIVLDDAQAFPPQPRGKFFRASLDGQELPIEPGSVRIDGSVTLVYDID